MTRWSLAGRLAWILSTILAVLWLGASLLSALVIRAEILEVSDGALRMLAGALLQEQALPSPARREAHRRSTGARSPTRSGTSPDA